MSAAPRQLGLISVVAGVVGIVLCVLTPFLPVTVAQASFDWPRGPELTADDASVTAPLITQAPQSVNLVIPCATLAALPADGGVVVSTMPAAAPNAKGTGLFVTAARDSVVVTFRNSRAAVAARAELGRCSQLHVWSSATATGAQFVGLGPRSALDPDQRPQVAGMFTELSTEQVRAALRAGLAAHVDVDSRFDSSPSALKLVVMVLAVLAVTVSLVCLLLLDRAAGYRARIGRRASLRVILRPRISDLLVTAVLVIWLFLGAGSADDGYLLGMGRVADSFGYLANYYRFAGIPEAPFDWYYAFLAHWSAISPSILWMHIPPMLAGLASWFVLSRVLLPRLGPAVRGTDRARGGVRGWAMAAAAATFTAFWLPLCSGLRSEGIIVLGSLLTWWAVERAIATRRMTPAALAAIGAGFTLALAPHGVIGPAILIVSARPLLRILLARRHEAGLAPLLAPLAAAGMLVAVVVFRDQTVATVAEAVRVRYTAGPTLPWYQEYLRYYFLSVSTTDGALTRRVPVLLLLATLLVTVAVMLRRTRIRGVNPPPTWRLIGGIGVTLLLLAFTPTKWTIQFGIFAGLGAAIAATATVAVAQSAARSARNLTVFSSGLFFALAASMAGKNAWPFVYEYGISWFDRAPVAAGIKISNIFLVLAVGTAALATWQHLRLDYVTNKGLAHGDSTTPTGAGDRRRLVVASAPIALIAMMMVISEVLVFAKATVSRGPLVTVAGENLDTLRGNACGLADDVLVEPDANAGMLAPADGGSASATLAGSGTEGNTGFTPQGVPTDLNPKAGSSQPGQLNVAASSAKPFVISGGLGAGTTGGTGPTTVNGSTAALPFGLDPRRTPVLGSYGFAGTARLTTGLYRLPSRDSSPLLVFSTAGAVSTLDTFGVWNFGRKLVAQFGRSGADGRFAQLGPDVLPIDPGPVVTNRPWRNLRVPMSAVPPAATVMRLSLVDDNLGVDQYLVITPPRAPQLRTLQQVVGSSAPVLLDFTVGSQFPCQQPLRVTHGVAEIPRWRILPDYPEANSQSKTWQAADGGGLLAISSAMTTATAVGTYLRDDWSADWGALERLTPLAPHARVARTHTTGQTRWGWTRTGAMRVEADDDN
ncbi:MAG: arabinosyltransferase domain-containing protein [Gordonia sp. (in: high G+C Gram-positive bacteria)]